MKKIIILIAVFIFLGEFAYAAQQGPVTQTDTLEQGWAISDANDTELYGTTATNTANILTNSTNISTNTSSISGKQDTSANLNTISAPTAWRFFYSNGSSVLTELTMGSSGTVLTSNGSTSAPSFQPGGTGSGDVTGPASSTDNAFPRYDSTTGKIIQNGQTTEDDSGNVEIAGDLSVNGTISTNPTSAPRFSQYDSDSPGTDKEVYRQESSYVSGVDGSENTEFSFWAKIAGTFTNIFEYDVGTDTVQFNKPIKGGYDDIITTSTSGATLNIDFSASNDQTVNVGENVAITVVNWEATGKRPFMSIKLVYSAAYTVTIGGVDVSRASAGSDMIVAWTDDGGTTVNAYIVADAIN